MNKMKYAILSDIHGNLEALNSVFDHLGDNYDRFVCLGDIIGYGPDPNDCMDKIFEKSDLILAGNHEVYVNADVNYWDLLNEVTEDAKKIVKITGNSLNKRNLSRLKALVEENPLKLEEGNLIFVHSDPSDPKGMAYLDLKSKVNRKYFSRPENSGKICFVGHTHRPDFYIGANGESEGGRIHFDESIDVPVSVKKEIPKGSTVFHVVPSVGQPRDRFNYSGYSVYDSDSGILEVHRVPYDITETQRKMREMRKTLIKTKRFSEKTIERLELGA